MKESRRWATRRIKVKMSKSNYNLTAEDLPDTLRMPATGDAFDLQDVEVEYTEKKVYYCAGEKVPSGLTTSERKWLKELAEAQGLDWGETTERTEVEPPSTFSQWYSHPLVQLTHHNDIPGLERHPREIDGHDFTDLRKGIKIRLNEWDDPERTQADDDDDIVEVKVVEWSMNGTLRYEMTTSSHATLLDDERVKRLCREITTNYRKLFDDPNAFGMDCEVDTGAERTLKCDPSFIKERIE